MKELLPVGTFVRYQIKGAFDGGMGIGKITKIATGLVDGSTRKFYIVQDGSSVRLAPIVLPEEILEVLTSEQ